MKTDEELFTEQFEREAYGRLAKRLTAPTWPYFVVVLGVVCSIGWTVIWQLREIVKLLEGMQ